MTGAKVRQSYTQKVEDDDVYDGKQQTTHTHTHKKKMVMQKKKEERRNNRLLLFANTTTLQLTTNWMMGDRPSESVAR
jgi:hypothetical protein